MNTQEALTIASDYLTGLRGHRVDILSLSKPRTLEAALHLFKIVSKLSPLLGNQIEFNAVEYLNSQSEFKPYGRWFRQDPDFPDTIFKGAVLPQPGLEIKAWFPLATEITARFRESQNRFEHDHIYVVMLAWIPENVLYGRPRILDVCVVSARTIALARDTHYHNPPDYLVIEPEETAMRTRNLRQTNTNGHKWQGIPDQFKEAEKIVAKWGTDGKTYKPTRDYQNLLRTLIARYPYRLDTNFAKMDRIVHSEIESFKKRVKASSVRGITVADWAKLGRKNRQAQMRRAFQQRLEIRDPGN